MADKKPLIQSIDEKEKERVEEGRGLQRRSSRENVLRRYPSWGNLMNPEGLEQEDKEQIAKDREKLWELMSSYLPNTEMDIQRQFSDHVEYTLARDRSNLDDAGAYLACAYSVRDKLVEFWNDTNYLFAAKNQKQVYYLSIEYLMGRSLRNALVNMDIQDPYKRSLAKLGYQLEDLYDEEVDAGLGNGGLGRLAACYLDSLASRDYCAWGYGIRYTYGMFRQEIRGGFQVEIPDAWLSLAGNPWEFVRWDIKFNVRFYGSCSGNVWAGGEVVRAVAYDTPIPGYQTKNTINLRLWQAAPGEEFDLSSFNEGNYYRALEAKQRAETISSVLYPKDDKEEGKELRLKQQYFFVSATIQDIIRRFRSRKNNDWKVFPEKVAMQLNDTHPTIAVPELMRIMMDTYGLNFDEAFDLCRRSFNYTNHTVLPEALEKWPVPLLEKVLPRHVNIIYEINQRFLDTEIRSKMEEGIERQELCRRLSIVEEGYPKQVRMAYLAIVMSNKVNGVAKIHSDIIRTQLFKEFADIFPHKFTNVTNGVTPRRWLKCCNPDLSRLITTTLRDDSFFQHLDRLNNLKKFADDPDLQKDWMRVKLANKIRLARWIKEVCRVEVNPHALFDIHIKRIHEYKRQLLNILRVIDLYLHLRELCEIDQTEGLFPKVVIFGGKAASGYARAKSIIKLITSVADTVNNDKSIQNLLKVVFVPNYNVSKAELIIPASDLSQHISTAGTEASGTSNMKFALNGGLIIGTLDGANIEIRDCIGHENMFIFGLEAHQVDEQRHQNQSRFEVGDPRLRQVLNAIRKGMFGDPGLYWSLVDGLTPQRDHYLLEADFNSYLAAHREVDKAWRDRPRWAKMSILSTAGMGFFTSDRSVDDYAKNIWNVSPIEQEFCVLAPETPARLKNINNMNM